MADLEDAVLISKESNGSAGPSTIEQRRPRPKLQSWPSRFLDEGSGEEVIGTAHVRWTCAEWLVGTSRGQWFSLIFIGILLITLGIAAWSMTGGNGDYDDSFQHSLWISWGLFFDPGTQTGIPATDPLKVKAVAFMFSVLGFIYNLSLLGLVVDLIRNNLEYWKSQNSRIVQNNHTLVLGLSGRTVLLLHELLIAYDHKKQTRNQDRSVCCLFRCCPGRWRSCRMRCSKRRAIVILADMDEFEMETIVTAHLNEHRVSTDKIYFRKGDPSDWRELVKVSPNSADDIIVVGRGSGSPHESDQEVLRIILALAALPKDYQVSGEVFAEMRISENIHTVCAVLPKANGIASRSAVNRMFCLMGMDPAVGCCMVDLASFKSGDQLFILHCPPELIGMTFEEACYVFPYAILIGVRLKDPTRRGIRHPTGEKLKRSDRLVLLASTRENANFTHPGTVDRSICKPGPMLGSVPPLLSPRGQIICMIGCPADYTDLLWCMNMSVGPGSEVHILSEKPVGWREDKENNSFGSGETMDNQTPNITVVHYVGPTSSRRHLSELPLERAHAVLIMAECEQVGEDSSAADSRNLNSVVALRRCEKGPQPGCSVICELQDNRSEMVVLSNKSLSTLCAYFHSNSLETAMFAMAAEDRAVFNSLLELLTPGRGAQINGIPVRVCIEKVETLNFWQLHAKVLQQFGSILIGWHREDGHQKAGIEVQLNPEMKDQPLKWNPDSNQHLLVVMRPPVLYTNAPLETGPGEDFPEGVTQSDRDAASDGGMRELPGQVRSHSPGPSP